MVSPPRRSEPATATRSTPSTLAAASATRPATATATPRRCRPPNFSAKASDLAIPSIFFFPKPLSSSSRPSAIAAFKSAMDSTSASCQKRAADLGPMPETPISSTTPAGTRSLSSSWSATTPVSTNSKMRSAVPVPTPGSATSSERLMPETSSSIDSRTRAALTNAFTLKPLPPSTSVSRAMSSKIAAKAALSAWVAGMAERTAAAWPHLRAQPPAAQLGRGPRTLSVPPPSGGERFPRGFPYDLRNRRRERPITT